jgi:hypothetical protein
MSSCSATIAATLLFATAMPSRSATPAACSRSRIAPSASASVRDKVHDVSRLEDLSRDADATIQDVSAATSPYRAGSPIAIEAKGALIRIDGGDRANCRIGHKRCLTGNSSTSPCEWESSQRGLGNRYGKRMGCKRYARGQIPTKPVSLIPRCHGRSAMPMQSSQWFGFVLRYPGSQCVRS